MTRVYMSGMPTFTTDFNRRDANGRLVSLATGTAMYWLGTDLVGNRALLKDLEGNTLEGIVDEVDGQIVKFVAQWESWSTEAAVVDHVSPVGPVEDPVVSVGKSAARREGLAIAAA